MVTLCIRHPCVVFLPPKFLNCLEALLGVEGGAPPPIVDGAIAGLGAVLGEMHREGLFTGITVSRELNNFGTEVNVAG